MDQQQLRDRTKLFATRIVRLFRALPKNEETRVIGQQLLRCGTSVAANYRAVCRARSRAEFISKMSIVVEECDESALWMELLVETDIVKPVLLKELLQEANELTAIFASARKTAMSRRNE